MARARSTAASKTVDIIRRLTMSDQPGVIYRVLACGHTQVEPSGGKAPKQLRARCVRCGFTSKIPDGHES